MGSVINIIIDINSELLRLYEKNDKNIQYSINLLLSSIINEYTSEAFKLYENFGLSGESQKYEIDDELITKMKSKCNVNISIDKLANTFAWIAFLFPEI